MDASINEENPKLIVCAHCQGQGTCRNGENGVSCGVCVSRHKLKAGGDPVPVGLVCGVCQGHGMVPASKPLLWASVVPILVLLIAYLALGLVAYFAGTDQFHEVLAFAATLIGSMTGYFFSGREKL